jgi:ornithine--oxo-acid transaminase
MVEQAKKLTLTSRAFRNDQLALSTRSSRAHRLAQDPADERGAEAVESALKAVRKWGYEVKGVPADRAEIIVCANNFHGRTLASSASAPTRTPAAASARSRRASRRALRRLRGARAAAINENTVAFLVEPIQGEAGVIIPPAGYFRRCARSARERNVTLILDEIQTGSAARASS